MTPSSRGLDLIKEFESCRLSAYKDGGGVWTIGWGTTLYPNGVKVKRGDTITQAQADAYFIDDIAERSTRLDQLLKGLTISQNQYDALLSFVYNLGVSALSKSTLLRLIKINPYHPDIRYQFSRWNKDNGKVVAGLTRRRKAEAELYFS